MTFGTPQSFEDFAANAIKELEEIRGSRGGFFGGKTPPGEYLVQFLGATMVADKFNRGQYTPQYRFNHDGVEKILESKALSLAANLKGKEGGTVTLIRGFNQKTGKSFWDVR